MVFAMQNHAKTLIPSEGFQGTIKKDYNLNLSTFSLFLRNDKVLLGNKIQEMFPDKLSQNLGNDNRTLILENTSVRLLYKWKAEQ